MDHPCPDIRRAPRVALSDSPAEQHFLEIVAMERHGKVIPLERRANNVQTEPSLGERVLFLEQSE